jgi:hypothetical protein
LALVFGPTRFRIGLAGAAFASAFLFASAAMPATDNEIVAALSGRTAFEAGKTYRPWRQFFAADGGTIYFGDGPSSAGHWKAEGGQYCSLWPPSDQWACYQVVIDGSPAVSITWISPDGTRESGALFDGDLTGLRAPPVP